MKKTPILALLMTSSIALAQTTTYTGPPNDSIGSVVTSGQATFSLARSVDSTDKVIKNVFYADQYCANSGTYDQSCLSNAIAAAGNNSKVVLSPHLYTFASMVTATHLQNVTIEATGATISMDTNAFQCTSCSGGGWHGGYFQTLTKPTVISCSWVTSNDTMSCPSLPTSGVISLDPWGTGIGHLPTADDASILVAGQTLTTAQQREHFDTGLLYFNSSSFDISGTSGMFYHIVLVNTTDAKVHDNRLIGGTGAGTAYDDGSHRCGAICLWGSGFAAGVFLNKRPEIYNNTIFYAASRSIGVISSDSANIHGNHMYYAGEGGIVTGQGNGYYSVRSKISGNYAAYSSFDGFDTGSDYPPSSKYSSDQIVENNTSEYNFRTGFFGDGLGVHYVGNKANHNGLSGFDLNVGHSLVDGNQAYDNSANNPTNGQITGQILIGVSGVAAGHNTVTNNHVRTDRGITPNGSGITINNGAGNPPVVFWGNHVYGGLKIIINPNRSSYR
jgi:hypothetical protein